jgi:hypothetical protein
MLKLLLIFLTFTPLPDTIPEPDQPPELLELPTLLLKDYDPNSPYRRLLAYAVLTQKPVEITEDNLEEQTVLNNVLVAYMKQELVEVAEELEILSSNEWWSTASAIFVQEMQHRYHQVKDAPPLNDCRRFPDYRYAGEQITLNNEYRHYINLKLSMEPWRFDKLKAASNEANRLNAIWDDVRCISLGYTVFNTRLALKTLRERLGEAAYYAGDLPPPVPLQFFNLIP